jgi:hypothetical protein
VLRHLNVETPASARVLSPACPCDEAERIKEQGRSYANFFMPCWTQSPPCPLGSEAVEGAWVPMDETHTMLLAISTDTSSLANHPNARLAR